MLDPTALDHYRQLSRQLTAANQRRLDLLLATARTAAERPTPGTAASRPGYTELERLS